jgi:hypothetical protein
MLWRAGRTPIHGDGDGRFIATASHCRSAYEAAAIRLKMAPERPERRPFVSSWMASNESKMLETGKPGEPQGVARVFACRRRGVGKRLSSHLLMSYRPALRSIIRY